MVRTDDRVMKVATKLAELFSRISFLHSKDE